MFDPKTVVSIVENLVVTGAVIFAVVCYLRLSPIMREFFIEAKRFMQRTEHSLVTIETNHLHTIQETLKRLEREKNAEKTFDERKISTGQK